MNENENFGFFNDIRTEAKFIDEGIRNLMKKLEQPNLLGLQLEGVDLKADALKVLDDLENNVDILENSINSFLLNHEELNSHYKENLGEVEQYIEDISADLENIEKKLVARVENYIPYNYNASGNNSLQTVEAGNNSLQSVQSDYQDLENSGHSIDTNVSESNIGDGLKKSLPVFCTPIPNEIRNSKTPVTVKLNNGSDKKYLTSGKENVSIKTFCDRFMISKPATRPIIKSTLIAAENSMTLDNTISNNYYVPVPAKNKLLENYSSPLLLTADNNTLEHSALKFRTTKKLPKVPVGPSLSAFSLQLLGRNGSFK